MAARLVSSTTELSIHFLSVPSNRMVIGQVRSSSPVDSIERNWVVILAQMLTALHRSVRHRILLRNSNGHEWMYFGWMVDWTMMDVMMMVTVGSYFRTKERMWRCVVNRLALFVNGRDCMEGMDADESIPDDRKEIVEGNAVVQCFRSLWAVAETLAAFDLNHHRCHLQHSVAYHSVVSLMAVSLEKIK